MGSLEQSGGGSSTGESSACGKTLIADQGGEVEAMADGAVEVKDERRCGTCRGFRPSAGECRMGPPVAIYRKRRDEDGVERSVVETQWPKPPDGADDPGCEAWAERVAR